MEDKPVEEVVEITHRFAAAGVNILDCWMPNPEVRSALGEGIRGQRDHWIIQGHIGATRQDGQYVRTRDMDKVRPAFEDLLARLGTDHVELGMIHYVDDAEEFKRVVNGEFMAYVRELKATGAIVHVGLSTHNPDVALLAACQGEIEAIMFSVNPVDMTPA
ncbi:MAG: aldo/keto reductase [Slackia sp.]